MQSFQSFLIATVMLLLTPGPTNTLLALAGARAGISQMVRLITASLLGYACGLVPVILVGNVLFASCPLLATGLKIAAGLWVLLLAARLWRTPSQVQTGSSITLRDVFVTTLLNPKVLVFGLVLLPPVGSPEFAFSALALGLAISATGLLWGLAGGLMLFGENARRRADLFQRGASLWLACFAVTLIGTMLLT